MMSALILPTTRGRRPGLVARLRLRRLDHRLERSWRRARAERDALLLAALRGQIGAALAAVTTGPAHAPQVGADTVVRLDELATAAGIVAAEVTFGDGWVLRLGPCHAPAVTALATMVASARPVSLERVRRHGKLWVMDFAGPEKGALLAPFASLHHGGTEDSAAPASPARPGRDLVLAAGTLRP